MRNSRKLLEQRKLILPRLRRAWQPRWRLRSQARTSDTEASVKAFVEKLETLVDAPQDL